MMHKYKSQMDNDIKGFVNSENILKYQRLRILEIVIP